MSKSYKELLTIDNFFDRFNYLKIGGSVGQETFGSNRYLNQLLYKSKEWRKVRRDIIIRDMGNDLATIGREIIGPIIVHHINPITVDDILNLHDCVFDENNLICSSDLTHKAIHYGDENILKNIELIIRKPNDTVPWRV